MSTTAGGALRVIDDLELGVLVGGTWRSSSDGRRFEVEDPSTGETIAEVADGTARDGLDALAAAADAFDTWSRTPSRTRSRVLRRAHELMVERCDDLARLATIETGKPLAQARGEVLGAADFMLWYSEEAVRANGRIVESPDGAVTIVATRQPVGPCLLLTTWNYPAVTVARKMAPALAAGCTVVCKPAELAPLSGLAIAQILVEAGAPDGVVNVVPTLRPGELVTPLLADPRTRKVSLTGSTPIGKRVLAESGANVLRASMELGGNAPFIVFADADLDLAVEEAAFSKARGNGATCVAANRIFAEAPIADEFARRLADRLGSMRLGPGMDPESELGPLISEREVAKTEELLADATARGASVLCGGARIDGPGHFFPPTVLTGVDPASRVVRQEIFGPLAPVFPFADEREAIARANDTDFGLVGYVFTRDLDRATRVSERLESGMVGINQAALGFPAAPFGGIKWSGVGREGGAEGLEEYLNVKYVGIRRPQEA